MNFQATRNAVPSVAKKVVITISDVECKFNSDKVEILATLCHNGKTSSNTVIVCNLDSTISKASSKLKKSLAKNHLGL